MKTPTRIDRIRSALKKHGPMTAKQISEIVGLPQADTSKLIVQFRANPGKKMRIRHFDKIQVDSVHRSWIYELSNEPDKDVLAIRTRSINDTKPRLTREEIGEQRYLNELASKIQPFRDEMIFLTAGRAA